MTNNAEHVGPAGDRGPQGDHGQDGQQGQTGSRGVAGPEGITLDRFPLLVLIVVVALAFGLLFWCQHNLTMRIDDAEHQIVRLQDQVTDLRQP